MTLDPGAVDAVLAALADPTRRAVLDALVSHGGATATTLSAELPVTRQAVVKHLGILERGGLVSSARSGREVHYTVRPDRLDATAHWMAQLATQWETRLQAIKRLAEEPE